MVSISVKMVSRKAGWTRHVKHWHGAKKISLVSLLEIEIEGENSSNLWFNPIKG